jgi:hypothetical protein
LFPEPTERESVTRFKWTVTPDLDGLKGLSYWTEFVCFQSNFLFLQLPSSLLNWRGSARKSPRPLLKTVGRKKLQGSFCKEEDESSEQPDVLDTRKL